MDERKETIADIIAEMRGLVKPGETLENAYELLNGLADRIEAAQKCETGNAAKMLEALEAVDDAFSNGSLYASGDCPTPHDVSVFEDVRDKVKAALAEPPRNCDRFGTDNVEALLEYEDVCEKSETEESVADAFLWLFSLAYNTKGDAK